MNTSISMFLEKGGGDKIVIPMYTFTGITHIYLITSDFNKDGIWATTGNELLIQPHRVE